MVKDIDKYNYFVQYMSKYITAPVIQKLVTDFEQDKYTDKPSLILKEIEDFNMGKWREAAKGVTRVDWTDKRAKTVEDNYRIFLRSVFIKGLRRSFKDVDNKDIVYDWSPLFTRYNDLTKAIFRRPKKVPKVERLISEIEGKSLPVLKVSGEEPPELIPRTSKKIIKEFTNMIDRADRGGKVDSLLALRNAAYNASFQKTKILKSQEAYDLYKKANEALKKYEDVESNLTYRKDDELRNALALKGVDVSKLTTTSDIRDAAKTAGIGLRKYAKTREDLISDLQKVSTLSREDIEKNVYTNAGLRQLLNKITRAVKPSKKQFYFNRDDLTANEKKVRDMYKSANLRFTKRDIGNMDYYVSTLFPGMIKKEREKEVLKRLAGRIHEVPTIESEIEKRYMNWKYGDRDRVPTQEDLNDLYNTSTTDLRVNITSRVSEEKDPTTGKVKVVRGDFIPKEAILYYKTKYLKPRIEVSPEKMAKAQRERAEAEAIRAKEQERKFVERSDVEFGF